MSVLYGGGAVVDEAVVVGDNEPVGVDEAELASEDGDDEVGTGLDVKMGSEEPVRSDAAVAAAATLRRVPSTSILPGEIAE